MILKTLHFFLRCVHSFFFCHDAGPPRRPWPPTVHILYIISKFLQLSPSKSLDLFFQRERNGRRRSERKRDTRTPCNTLNKQRRRTRKGLFWIFFPPFFSLFFFLREEEKRDKKRRRKKDLLHSFASRRKRLYKTHTLSRKKKEKHTTTTIMGEEADTETFAFQAEINQLLSLIINVRLQSFFGIIIIIIVGRFFSSSSSSFDCALTTTRWLA